VHATIEGFASLLQNRTACVEGLEKRLIDKANADLVVEILGARRDLFELSQRLSREHDAIRRLAGREVVEISDEMAVRFRDVQNRLNRLLDTTRALEHRLGDLLTAASVLAARKRWM
jgi:Mg2+ and Co2+ transporter CorA